MKQNHIAIEVSQEEHFHGPFLKQIKENWPSLARDYRHYCRACHPKQGDIWIWTSPEGQKFVHFVIGDAQGTLLTSDERLHHFRSCLKHLMKVVETERIEKIDFPKGSFKFNDLEMQFITTLKDESFKNFQSKTMAAGGV